jgi:putative addiction module component (TIGR02574 family)
MATLMEQYGLGALSPDERARLAAELWDSLAEEVEKQPLTEAQQQEIDRRLAAHRVNPAAAIPWEQVEAQSVSRCSASARRG